MDLLCDQTMQAMNKMEAESRKKRPTKDHTSTYIRSAHNTLMLTSSLDAKIDQLMQDSKKNHAYEQRDQ